MNCFKIKTIILSGAMALSCVCQAAEKVEPSTVDKAKEVVKETSDSVADGTKKAYRKLKDETCEMINGKMECIVKKTKHKIQNMTDEAATKAKK